MPAFPIPIGGLRTLTSRNLVFDAGALFKNINMTMLAVGDATSFDEAINPVNTWVDSNGATVTPSKLGATRGGSTITPVRTERQVEFDSRRTDIKGFSRVDMIGGRLKVSLLETGDPETWKLSLGSYTEATNGFWTVLTQKLIVADGDYLDNIALAATISGENLPLLVVLSYARVTEVSDFSFTDKNELVIPLTFTSHAVQSDQFVPGLSYWIPNQFITS